MIEYEELTQANSSTHINVLCADFAMMQNRFARLIDTLSICSYESLTKAVGKDPRLILPIAGDEKIVEKILYMVDAVGNSQENDLVNLLIKRPEILFTKSGNICRLEYLRDCGGAGNQEREVRLLIKSDPDDELCSVAGGVITPPLLVGQIPAVLCRGAEPMMARHPYYDVYVLVKVLESVGVEYDNNDQGSNGEKIEMYRNLGTESLEQLWAAELLGEYIYTG